MDWLVDGVFFAALGYGTWMATDQMVWLWLGIAAIVGATIDFCVDLVLDARAASDPAQKTREQIAADIQRSKRRVDWLIYVYHTLSRTAFCFVVFLLALVDLTWILLPLGAIGAQAYWNTDLFKRARVWRT